MDNFRPFASARKTTTNTEHTAGDYPQLVPPGPANAVTQAGREFSPRPLGADRRSRTQPGLEREPGQIGESTWDSVEAESPARSAARPTPGMPLDHAPDY